MKHYEGPLFESIREVSWKDLSESKTSTPDSAPMLVKGAVEHWPAFETWTFVRLAELKRFDGREARFNFQNGLVEQGTTRRPVDQMTGDYLRELSRDRARRLQNAGSSPNAWIPGLREEPVRPGDPFRLNWDHFSSFPATQVYLAQWSILRDYPQLTSDLRLKDLWPGTRLPWTYTSIGPQETVIGLHYDFPNNWLCQFEGTKEVILFPRDQSKFMCQKRKFDWGATLSDIDISRLTDQKRESSQFALAKDLYARIEPGDALYIPKRTWHAVVSLTPSITLAVFGLTLREAVIEGAISQFKGFMHSLGLYRRNLCTCHEMPAEISEMGTPV